MTGLKSAEEGRFGLADQLDREVRELMHDHAVNDPA